jgi:hypothetical protein
MGSDSPIMPLEFPGLDRALESPSSFVLARYIPPTQRKQADTFEINFRDSAGAGYSCYARSLFNAFYTTSELLEGKEISATSDVSERRDHVKNWGIVDRLGEILRANEGCHLYSSRASGMARVSLSLDSDQIEGVPILTSDAPCFSVALRDLNGVYLHPCVPLAFGKYFRIADIVNS